MTVVLTNKVVQITFVQEFVPIDHVEQACEEYEGRGRNQSECDPVLSEKVLEYGAFALQNLLFVAGDVQIENKAVNDWVDFEMNTQAID